MANSLRDELKDRLRDLLVCRAGEYLTEDEINELVYDIADDVFLTLDVSDDLQDRPYHDALNLASWKAVPWNGQYELRDGEITIGFLGHPEDGAVPTARTRAYARLICAAPALLKACILALDREDVADSELGDVIRRVVAPVRGTEVISSMKGGTPRKQPLSFSR